MYTLEELSELGARGASQFHTNFTRLYRVGILRIAAFMFLYAATYTLQLCIVYKAVFCCCLVGFFFFQLQTHVSFLNQVTKDITGIFIVVLPRMT